jgi:hypothetical protein
MQQRNYIFFSEHVLVLASHEPPAFSQSAWVFAVDTSPAKAGPETASASDSANTEMSVFIDDTPLLLQQVLMKTQPDGEGSGLLAKASFRPRPRITGAPADLRRSADGGRKGHPNNQTIVIGRSEPVAE